MHPKPHFSTECSNLTFSYTTPLCFSLSHSKNNTTLCVIREKKVSFPSIISFFHTTVKESQQSHIDVKVA